MASSKKPSARPESPSAADQDPERDDEGLEGLEEDTPQPAKKRGAKKRKEGGEDEEGSQQPAKPHKKRSKKQAIPPPPEQGANEGDDDDEQQEEAEAEEEEEEDNEPVPDIDPSLVDAAFKEFRKVFHKLPSVEHLAEKLACSERVATVLIKKKIRAKERLKNERKAKKVSGYYKMAVAAGYGDLQKPMQADPDTQPRAFYSNVAAQAYDSHKPLLSMSDMLRCAKYVPSQATQTSFNTDEFAMRCDLLTTTLPADGARELLANADAVFKEVINRSVGVAMQHCSVAQVKPSHGIAVLKKMADNMLFSSINAPPGLVAHGKAVGALPTGEDGDRERRNATAAKANGQVHAAKKSEINAAAVASKARRAALAQAKADREENGSHAAA